MRMGRVVLEGEERVLAGNARLAETAFERMKGLIGRPPLGRGDGLWIEPCSSVHTFGMRCDIDLVFLSPLREIINLKQRVRPLRVAWAMGAAATLELWPGAIEQMNLSLGSRVRWEDAI